MNETPTEQATERCDPSAHDWQIVGRCFHGFGGSNSFDAVRCATCSQGGHRRRPGFACPRRGENKTERAARIERQAAECPVWDDMPADWQEKLRG